MGDSLVRYYDANTSRFLKYGHGGTIGAIHRAVWAEGVQNRREAVEYINVIIAEYINKISARQVLDIGCGIGGSMAFLARRCAAEFTGFTISPRQVQIGTEYLRQADCRESCEILQADFTDQGLVAQHENRYDLAFAVESFLHMEDGDRFFLHASQVIRTGGELLICDDFLKDGAGREGDRKSISQKRVSSWLHDFTQGWQVRSLLTPVEARKSAAKHGFECIEERDLSDNLELNRPRDRFIRMMIPMAKGLHLSSPFWMNLIGGNALQRLLILGSLQYKVLRFRRSSG